MSTATQQFLTDVSTYTANPNNQKTPSSTMESIRMGVIDPYYTAGLPHVTFDGDTVISSKGYSWVTTYNPVAGDRVALIPVGQSYIIYGPVKMDVPYPTYVPVPLSNGWVNYDTVNYYGASVTKTASGVVKVAGLVMGGTVGPDVIMGTLPPGFRPDKIVGFDLINNNASGGCYVDVDGSIKFEGGSSNAWASFDNIVFQTDPTIVWNPMNFQNSFMYSNPSEVPNYGKDAYGRVWLKGAAGQWGAPTPTADTVMFNLPSGYRPALRQHQCMTSGTFGFHDMGPTGDYRWKLGSSDASDNQYNNISDSMFYDASVTTGWNNGTYLNSWVSYDTTAFSAAQYRKDPDGLVYLRGLVKAGTMGASIMQLPAGYRPGKNLVKTTPSAAAFGRVDVNADGNVIPRVGSNVWVSLDGVSFTAAQ